VSVTAVLYGYGAGVNFYGFGVFFNPMREEFGWSRAATAGVFSLARLEGAPLGPIIGWLIDRVGSRRMMVAGLSLTGLGFISMYFIQSLWMFRWAADWAAQPWCRPWAPSWAWRDGNGRPSPWVSSCG
jgi:MFS family permease